jgi:hypothetical protein
MSTKIEENHPRVVGGVERFPNELSHAKRSPGGEVVPRLGGDLRLPANRGGGPQNGGEVA